MAVALRPGPLSKPDGDRSAEIVSAFPFTRLPLPAHCHFELVRSWHFPDLRKCRKCVRKYAKADIQVAVTTRDFMSAHTG
jgi:hypothetical protein